MHKTEVPAARDNPHLGNRNHTLAAGPLPLDADPDGLSIKDSDLRENVLDLNVDIRNIRSQVASIARDYRELQDHRKNHVIEILKDDEGDKTCEHCKILRQKKEKEKKERISEA